VVFKLTELISGAQNILIAHAGAQQFGQLRKHVAEAGIGEHVAIILVVQDEALRERFDGIEQRTLGIARGLLCCLSFGDIKRDAEQSGDLAIRIATLFGFDPHPAELPVRTNPAVFVGQRLAYVAHQLALAEKILRVIRMQQRIHGLERYDSSHG
jgi:hypothetical protein